MSVEAAIIIAGSILSTTLIVLFVLIAKRQQAAREDELKQEASRRGWTFESKVESGYRVHRWTGSTGGVSWRAESLSQAAGGKNRSERRKHIARWHGAWSPGISGAIVCMGLPKGKEAPSFAVAQGEGFFAKLAQKAVGFALDKSIDIVFGDALGKEVDAAALHRIDVTVPGFVVMAANKDEGTRVLQQGLEHALTSAAADKSSVLSDEERPSILLRPNGISLARMEKFRDLNDVDRFAHAGVALTRAFTFGRPSPS